MWSVGSSRIFAPWARACSQCALESSTRTSTECVTSPGLWRYAVVADVANDHRAAFPNIHLRPMVVADLESLDEAESLTQPTHRGAHIAIDEHRDRGRDRFDSTAAQLTRARDEGVAAPSSFARPSGTSPTAGCVSELL